jgi:hypothetical protein
MGNPCQWMPIIRMEFSNGPFNTFRSETGIYMRIFYDILNVIKINEPIFQDTAK